MTALPAGTPFPATLPPGYALHAFDPSAASAEDWARYHAYRRAHHAESRPEDPLTPDELVERQMRQVDRFSVRHRDLVEREGEFVAALYTEWMTPEAPAYASNAQYCWFDLSVLEGHRRRGIGRALLGRVLALNADSPRTVLGVGTEEESGHAFLRHFGFELKIQGAENRLDLQAVDWAMVERWVEEGRARSPETELLLFEDRIPDELAESYCRALSELLNTMPFEDLEHGEIVITPETMEENFYAWLANVEGRYLCYVTREPDGSISGITDVNFIPAKPDRVNQMFTGVHPRDRGRGLGKMLKAAMLQQIRARYPEARWVVTGNAESNAPMLAINRRLGFKTHRANSGYQVQREALAERLG